MNPLPILRNEWREAGTGYALAVALVALAVALALAMAAQESALRRASARAAEPFPILVGAAGGTVPLVLAAVHLKPEPLVPVPPAAVAALRADPGVASASPMVFGDQVAGHPVVGTDAALMSALVALGEGPQSLAGRLPAAKGETLTGADVDASLGATLVSSHGAAESGAGDDPAPHETLPYVVVGRLARTGTPWDRAVLVLPASLFALHGLPDDADFAQALVVRPKSVADAYRLRARFRGGGTVAVFAAEVLADLHRLLGEFDVILRVVAAAYQVLATAGVALALGALLHARRRQFVVLRALGATRGYVMAVVGAEVASVLVPGLVLGGLLGWVGAGLLAAELGERMRLTLVPAVWSGLPGALAPVLGVGLLATGAAMWMAYRAGSVRRIREG